MHRATPSNSSFRAYSAGGSRATIDSASDDSQMQSISGGMMKGEHRDDVEHPQNYGFTSVVADADKDKDGNVTESAEGFMQFMGGSRSLPVMSIMDDRRHRLKKLPKGDCAMYRGREDGQQFQMHDKGNFMSARSDKKNRIALVPDKRQQQGGQGGGGQGRAEGGGGQQQGSGEGQQQKQEGQESVYDDNEKSDTFFEQTKEHSIMRRGNGYVHATDSEVLTYRANKNISTRVTDDHVHIKFGKMSIFVNKSGCKSSVPITTEDDPD
jgi:hypothetical protein